jgi:hypothetical protein
VSLEAGERGFKKRRVERFRKRDAHFGPSAPRARAHRQRRGFSLE